MFIIWGTKPSEETLGYTEEQYRCANCGNVAYHRVFKRVSRFTIFWIPTFPLSTEYFCCCPVCRFGQKMEQQQAIAMARRTANQLSDTQNNT